MRFDSNDYTATPWTVGRRLLLKAGNEMIQLFHKEKSVATHARCWEYKKRIEAPAHVEQVRRLQKRLWFSACRWPRALKKVAQKDFL
ncbi:MAG: hypothetical protein M0R18_14940 [Deltaproteobacteria bacterium]|nr:hypothetical protein [Deltaproteobacteria bacterium]MDX9763238.1 hypothetical protein [Desulfomonilia bacterium]